MKLQKDREFYRACTFATCRVCDSQILKYASKLVSQQIQEKNSGSDLLPFYSRHYRNDSSVAILMLGLAGGVADLSRQIQADYPHLQFGEIIGIKGWLSRLTIYFFTERLPQLSSDMCQCPVGESIKQADLLSEEQMQLLLAEKKRNQFLFGELAVRKGWVSKTTVDFFLQYVAPKCESQSYPASASPSLIPA